ncbi:SDR family oxidoreductase [Lysinibacillus fusiformis]|uniref:SDR family oxidoreductase n=1 Tax=Lysinibacillus fusiformis TaxID=28031 RepID=UPI003AAC26FA
MREDKILITGVTSGVGQSLMMHLSKRMKVIALARNIENLVNIENVQAYQIDLSNLEKVSELLNQIIKEEGYIPYLINNAGVMPNVSMDAIDFERTNEAFVINAFSPTLIMQKLLPKMKENNFGRIINLTSGAPLNCSENYGLYSASKAALNAMTITTAKENANSNIKINLMSPGPCKTKMAPNGPLDPSVCHATVEYLLNLNIDGPTGKFFWLGHEIPLSPDLSWVNWGEGTVKGEGNKVL